MNSQRIQECTELATEILRNFELSELPVSKIILKGLRLCRLLGDEDGILLFTFESSGYPSTPTGMTSESWRIAKIAGRRYTTVEEVKGKKVEKEYAKVELVSEIEEIIESQKIHLAAASDPNVSITSANPNQFVGMPTGNFSERNNIVLSIKKNQSILQTVTGKLYDYVLRLYNKLMYGNIIEDTFTKARLQVNDELGKLCPKAIEKFISVYNNMDSDNPEDWANAVHSCRRILLDVANVLYPPQEEPIIIGGKKIRVGEDQYINRLIQFISSREGSKTFQDVVGADLGSIGMRLDAINDAVCKGTHVDVSKDEASRYIIHTYLLLSDIVSLDFTYISLIMRICIKGETIYAMLYRSVFFVPAIRNKNEKEITEKMSGTMRCCRPKINLVIHNKQQKNRKDSYAETNFISLYLHIIIFYKLHICSLEFCNFITSNFNGFPVGQLGAPPIE